MNKVLAGALAALLATGAWAAEEHHPHWGYAGKEGPQNWAKMDPGFGTCALGKFQSPIDIRGAEPADLPAIGFKYQPASAEVVNNGHTVQVNLMGGGSIDIGGDKYTLVQFHFHAPSEERINGKAYPMVAHFVHRSEAGKLAVVAVLFEQGKENATLAPVLGALPKSGAKLALESLDPAALLPADQGYYAFMGSLTTPPCSEEVRWQVLKKPMQLSKAQIAAFRKLYPMNARPVQPVNGRPVQQSRS